MGNPGADRREILSAVAHAAVVLAPRHFGGVAGEGGLEYLFGYHYLEGGASRYVGDWSFSAAEEKQAFQRFMDFQ
jgi:hypothetical protein